MSDQPKVQPLHALPLIAPITVTPAPHPTQVGVAKVPFQGRELIALQFTTPQGVSIFFMTPERAGQFADAVKELAGGIVVVPAGALVKP